MLRDGLRGFKRKMNEATINKCKVCISNIHCTESKHETLKSYTQSRNGRKSYTQPYWCFIYTKIKSFFFWSRNNQNPKRSSSSAAHKNVQFVNLLTNPLNIKPTLQLLSPCHSKQSPKFQTSKPSLFKQTNREQIFQLFSHELFCFFPFQIQLCDHDDIDC
mmetsp:Transcript_60585/g.89912  ORF Transcript_60585/g.89912 Transcript_60585/m.89912 type:complete len:161 (-) Transcript_60585:652-1134(-)